VGDGGQSWRWEMVGSLGSGRGWAAFHLQDYPPFATYKTAYTDAYKTYHTCMYIRLLEDKPSGSKHVEDIIKIKILI